MEKKVAILLLLNIIVAIVILIFKWFSWAGAMGTR